MTEAQITPSTMDLSTISFLTRFRGHALIEHATQVVHQASHSAFTELLELDSTTTIAHTLFRAQSKGSDTRQHREHTYSISSEWRSALVNSPRTPYHILEHSDPHLDEDHSVDFLLVVPIATHADDILGFLVSGFQTKEAISEQVCHFHSIVTSLINGTLCYQILSERSESLVNRLSYEVSHDHLTGLMNRNYLTDMLERMIEGYREPFTLIVIDIDHFQEINDVYGSYVGDNVLKHIAQIIQQYVPDEHYRFRLASDEFAIITESTEPMIICDEILNEIEVGYTVAPHSITLNAKVGFTTFNKDIFSAEQLIANASIALNDCKLSRNEKIRCFDTQLSQAYMRRARITDLLRIELNKPQNVKQELSVYMQPIVKKGQLEWNYFEVLARWNSHEMGHVSPVEFIAAAENSGLMVLLGKRIIELACKAKQELERSLGYNVKLGINCSPEQLDDPQEYIQFLTETLAKYHYYPDEFTIELTESVLLSPNTDIVSLLDKLRRLGFRIALDDFGTGYSSLNYIHSYPIDCIKIDATFVRNLLTNQTSEKVVSLIIHLAKLLNVDLVAEGVETIHELEKLYSMGCENIQGYYFSKPLPPSQLLSVNKMANDNITLN
ncbi:putative bifunctional diguanylate cyclase/phosphodiesterase [Vibrio nitrifigilis]|nr:bifunctional diguanylate cyclase/phosphodiesterase [Vibrio nitrifigilis]